MESIEYKRLQEKKIIKTMIEIYCKKKCKSKEMPCEECEGLIEYTHMKINKCPYMDTKSFCSSCNTHCYEMEYREKIKMVMRFSGPRLILYHPIAMLKHMIPKGKRPSK